MSWTLCLSGSALAKAGANYNVALNEGTMINRFSDESEATINAITRRDWIGLSSSTLQNFKGILDDCVSSHIAMKIINYDMSGYTSRAEAQTMLDVNNDIYNKTIAALNDEKVKEIMHTGI
jgi:hypothetical protein